MGAFVKKLVKKWTFLQRREHYVQYRYFFVLHFTYLGGAYAPNAPPAYGHEIVRLFVQKRLSGVPANIILCPLL